MLSTIAISGYRSLRDVVLPLDALTVITGANGAGKSNLYRALQLIADAATGDLIGALAREGGLSSVLWAGPEHITGAMRRGEQPVQGTARRTRPVALQLGFSGDDLGYLLDVGLPTPSRTVFHRDPQIKRELIFTGPVARPAALLVRRRQGRVDARDERWAECAQLDPRESVLAELADAGSHPEVRSVRRFVRGWRFYDAFRTDLDSPARTPQVGTHTPVLARDGHDLAPAIATILESAWAGPFARVVADAFDGAEVRIDCGDADGAGRPGLFDVAFHQPGVLRPLSSRELSDGTLRYLLLAAALLSPAPPTLLVLNEPETSLHPSLLAPLARLIVESSARSQVIVVTHAPALVAALSDAGARTHELEKRLSETVVADQELLSRPAWEWGSR